MCTFEQERRASARSSSDSLHAYQHPEQGLPIEGKCECCCTSCGLPESSSVHNVVSMQVTHPGDVCECGHKRSQHGSATPGGEHYCMVKEPDENGGLSYVDECEDFVLAETALDRLARLADAEIREFDRAAADELTRLDQEIDNEANRQADAANFDDVAEEHGDFTVCPECGHYNYLHTRDHGCEAAPMPDKCGCVVGMAVLPPVLDCCGHADDDHTETQGCIHCDCWFGHPDYKPEPDKAKPFVEGGHYYAVTFAVEGGTEHHVFIPHGLNAMVLDGRLQIFQPDKAALGITVVHTQEN